MNTFDNQSNFVPTNYFSVINETKILAWDLRPTHVQWPPQHKHLHTSYKCTWKIMSGSKGHVTLCIQTNPDDRYLADNIISHVWYLCICTIRIWYWISEHNTWTHYFCHWTFNWFLSCLSYIELFVCVTNFALINLLLSQDKTLEMIMYLLCHIWGISTWHEEQTHQKTQVT